MKKLLFLLLVFNPFLLSAQKKVSFTFDDGSLSDRPGYLFEEWNALLLKSLDEAGLKAAFFVSGSDKASEKGKALLSSWDNSGHLIANHSRDHQNYNKSEVSFEDFSSSFLSQDLLIRRYSHYTRLFRFPYLKEGNTPGKVALFRELMQKQGYRNGYVTIDASDWYIDSRLINRLKENPDADLEAFKEFYLAHIWERANYYEKLSFALTGRHIPHTLLLHHNLAAALFLNDLIAMFREKGWELVSAEEAYQDEIFKEIPTYAGESLVWALAKQSGKFEQVLRFPAEGSRYEKEKMDQLGL